MKYGLLACSLAVAALSGGGSAPSDPSVRPTRTVVHGVAWEANFDAALARAKSEGKPVLMLQMFGRLDDEFC